MLHLQDLDPGDAFPLYTMAIVEIPKGSAVRYKMHDKYNFLLVSAVLPEGIVYPQNYGFLPRTLAEDGDALDVFVVTASPLMGLAAVEVKILGGFTTESAKKGREEKLVGVYRADQRFLEVSSLDGLPSEEVKAMEEFLEGYLSGNAKKKIIGRYGPEKAQAEMKKCAAAYRGNRKNLSGE
ncbi:MAG: inorganic diphosphatase [Proteobacteria bacterium]|nr:MAG: inorganic diphosphatase [Pseudomonadota bacterium]